MLLLDTVSNGPWLYSAKSNSVHPPGCPADEQND